MFGCHRPNMPQGGYLVKPPDAVAYVLNSHDIPPSPKDCQRFLNLCRWSMAGVESMAGGATGLSEEQFLSAPLEIGDYGGIELAEHV